MRIKELREINDIQQKELAAELNIPASTLSQYETGKREPNIEIVKKIANFFNVSTDYIYGLSAITTCHDCGLSYCPDNKLDLATHKEIHSRWLKAKNKYGFCYSNYGERERIKVLNRNVVKDYSLPLDKRYQAQIEVFKCLFSRSLEASNYSDSFISFEEYVSMLLNQPSVKKRLGDELYQKMVNKFGTSEGIPDGQTYYYQYETSDAPTFAAHKDGENFTPAELDKIEEYKRLLIAARPKE